MGKGRKDIFSPVMALSTSGLLLFKEVLLSLFPDGRSIGT